MPGTFGTLAGIPVVMALNHFGPGWHVAAVILTALVSVWVADEAERLLGTKDPGCIVIDEVAGYVVTMSAVPVTAASLAAGFVLFRVFDIVKPPPVRYFDRNFHGGAGVVLDDLAAGLFGALVLGFLF